MLLPYVVHLLSPQELIADDNSAINDVNDHLKMELEPPNGKSASADLSSEMENSDHRHDFAHQIKQTGLSEDQQPGHQPCEIAFRPESREDGLTEKGIKTKLIGPKLHTESAEGKGSDVSSLFIMGLGAGMEDNWSLLGASKVLNFLSVILFCLSAHTLHFFSTCFVYTTGEPSDL